MSSDTSLLNRNHSADFCIDPADLNVADFVAPAPSNKQISILPAIDLNDGTIAFALPSGWTRYFHPEPAAVAAALRQAIKPAQWNPYLEVLTITIASEENRSGEAAHFSLTALRTQ